MDRFNIRARKQQYLVSVAAIVTLLGGPAAAQTQPNAPATASTPQDDNAPSPADQDFSGDIIVTAQRRNERLTDVPLTISVASASDLGKQGVTSTQQLFQVVSGLQMNNTGAWLQPSVRGVTSFGTNAGNSSNVATYIDGVYIPDQMAARLDLPDIERVEVAKGPQGTLFGRNATGGAIQVFTKGPSFTPGGRIEVGYGTFNDLTLSAFATAPLIKDVLAVSASGYVENGDSYVKDYRTGEPTNPVKVRVFRGKLLFTPNSVWTSNLSYSWSRRIDATGLNREPYVVGATQGIRQGGGVGLITTRPNYSSLNSPSKFNLRDERLSWKNDFDLGFAKLTSLSAYSFLSADMASDLDGSTSTLVDVPYLLLRKDRMYSEELTLVSPGGRSFGYTVGVFYYNDKNYQPRSRSNNGLVTTSALYDESKSAFGELYYNFGDHLQIIGGVRYTNERIHGFAFNSTRRVDVDKTWSNVSPRASLKYKIDDKTNLYLTYSEGFKSGGFNTAALQNLPPYNPEKLKSWELVFKTAGSKYFINLAAFNYNYNGIQFTATTAVPSAGLASIVTNAASAKLQGIEFDGGYRIGRNTQIRANASWEPKAQITSFPNAVINVLTPTPFNNGVPTVNGGCPAAYAPPCGPVTITADVSGARIPRTPRFSGNLALDQTIPDVFSGNLTLSGSVYYSSSVNQTLNGSIHQGQYALLGANVSWSSADERYKLTLRGSNLTDVAEITGVSDVVFGQLVNYNRPRAFQAIFALKF
jgi:iron complex outermembrane receptor protein